MRSGCDNFSAILHDQVFWHTLLRTVVFTAVNVGLTMVLGTLIALLLVRVSDWVRDPPDRGARARLGDAAGRRRPGLELDDELPERRRQLRPHRSSTSATTSSTTGTRRRSRSSASSTTLIVWGALPFVAITRLRGARPGAARALEAAEIDGARPWRVFRDVTFPMLTPVLLILTSLSIIWDFGVFTQPYLLIGQGHIHPGNYLMGIYLFEEGYVKTDFGRGAAISILMLVMVAR